MIADDDEFFRVALSSLLRERNDFKAVIECPSLDDAVEELTQTTDITLGLFDLNMVGMDNWVDLSALRGEFPNMRLVVVSASQRCDDILMALSIGSHGYVHKGMGVKELSRAIEIVCSGDVYVPPFLPDKIAGQTQMQFSLIAPGGEDDARGSVTVRDSVKPDRGDRGEGVEDGTRIGTLQCTPRQREIVSLLIKGYSNKAMARELDLSEGTIKFHMSAVLRLLGASSRVAAATRAMALLQPEDNVATNPEA
ncbi:LuxR C-terminal-related transcriptional regulator [Cribrihabitans sp. XS_ASV171]